VFDLKGSTYGRVTKTAMNNMTVRKDLDFIAAKKRFPSYLSLAKINQVLIKQMRSDIAFLKEKNLIDYSLLLAVEKSQEKFDTKKIEFSRQVANAVSS